MFGLRLASVGLAVATLTASYISGTGTTGAPAAPRITTPVASSVVPADSAVVVAGDGAEDGATVTVSHQSGTELCDATASPTGEWVCAPIMPGTLPHGPSVIHAHQRDSVGKVSPPSSKVAFSYGENPVRIDSPTNGSRTTPRPTITGVATPGATVSVSWAEQKPSEAVVTTSDSDGDFSVTLSSDLPEGPQTLQVSQVHSNDTGAQHETSASVDVLIQADVTPIALSSPADGSIVDLGFHFLGTGEPFSDIFVQEKGSDNGSMFDVAADGTFDIATTPLLEPRTYTFVLTQSADGSVVEVTVTIRVEVQITSPSDDEEVGPRPVIAGIGTPGAQVTVATTTSTLFRTEVGSDGTWSLTPSSDLGPGPQVVTATQDVDASSDVVSFSVVVPPVPEEPDASPTPTPMPAPEQLATTGFDPTSLVGAAGLLLFIGVATLISTRLRRQRTESDAGRAETHHV